MCRYVVCIGAPTMRRLRELERVHSLELFRLTARAATPSRWEVHGVLSETQIHRLRAEGACVEVLADADALAARRKRYDQLSVVRHYG